jgi:hypothetical protein
VFPVRYELDFNIRFILRQVKFEARYRCLMALELTTAAPQQRTAAVFSVKVNLLY